MPITAIPKLETGVPGLDILTHGGIPPGRTTLVCGRSGTGKTILGRQMATHLAARGHPPVVLAV
jgi:circadian clock protein KaiC